ncbi:phosphoesterase RecJ domain protein [Ammonifex degensii KC4]|uniref:Phosphoesterase RecJ domain protein n=1 Tax=Ammonifex degensii (strain DSM 10501 / KC4) TaxID=429009 RepID=C9R8X4_AMMDK|nr:bifunctional oligoribonuclease/PAP phosphatase NrnA [Ammonifex degensii]ACX52753.1 phosphoesterase RecJ domain protein [Ammonifex degensii KC4]
MESLKLAARELEKANKLLLLGHMMPDGDCLGSMLALGQALRAKGKKVEWAVPDPVPSNLAFLPGAAEVKVGPQAMKEGSPDLLVVLDTSTPERLGDMKHLFDELRRKGCKAMLIDHHVTAIPFADYNFIFPEAAAVGEVVFELLREMSLFPLTPDIATCLYTAIVTDTGCFQYETTLASTHRRVAELVEAGVKVREISLRLFEEKPREQIVALREALKTLRFSSCGRLAWMWLDRETMAANGILGEHTNGLVNYARQIQGVELALFFWEVKKDLVKVSFRSKRYLDVNRLAGLFGGGGHIRAAGALIPGRLEDVVAKVVAAGLEALQEQEGD